MRDVNAALAEALSRTGIGCSEAPYKPREDTAPYITWETGKEINSYASGVKRLSRVKVNVVIWMPDGVPWHETLASVRAALTDAGIPNGFGGAEFVQDVNRKALLIPCTVW